MQSRNAVGNLVNRYKAVLKKCNLLNVFGSLAVVSALTVGMFGSAPSVFAAVNDSTTPILSMDASDGSFQLPANQVPALNDTTLINNGTIKGGATYDMGIIFTVGMFGSGATPLDFSFTNNGLIDININEAPLTGTITNYLGGMLIDSEGNHTLINEANSNITITNTITSSDDNADGIIFGIAFQNGSPNPSTNTLTNSGSVTISNIANAKLFSTATTSGVVALGGTKNTVTNEAGAEITITNEAHATDAEFTASVIAMGIQTTSGDHSLKNMGVIDITNEGSSTNNEGSSTVFAMQGSQGGNGSLTLTNSKAITVSNTANGKLDTTAITDGLKAEGGTKSILTNEAGAEITITNEAHSTDGTFTANASAMSIDAVSGTHVMENMGVIDITNEGSSTNSDGYAEVYAMQAQLSGGSGNLTATNSGTLKVSNTVSGKEAYAFAFGLIADKTTNTSLTNKAGAGITIINEAHTDGISSAYASAMAINSISGDHSMTNMGLINITNKASSISADSDTEVIAMRAELTGGSGNLTATNSGTLNILNNAKALVDSSISSAAIMLSGNGSHNATNSGTITIENIAQSTNGDAGIEGLVLTAAGDGNHTITNSGTIRITSTATSTNGNATSIAMGMMVQGTPTTQHVLTNTGIIDARAFASAPNGTAIARAYEAYGLESFTVDTWATTLRTWDANDAVFALDNGKILTFKNGTAGATLIVRPDTAERGFVEGEVYDIAKMVAIFDGANLVQQKQFAPGFIEGSIAQAITEVDFLTATLGGTSTNPTVSLSLNTKPLPTNAITADNLNAKLAHMKGINELTKNAIASLYANAGLELAQAESAGIAAGSMAEKSKWTVFATPYGTYTDNSEYNFDSGMFGLTGGVTYNFSDQFALGGHLDFNMSNSDANNLESDAYSFAFGAHSYYFVNPKWYVSGNATLAFGNNDVEYTQSFGRASDDFSTFAIFAGVHTGYLYEINENNTIIPEIGLSYLYSDNDAYNLHFIAPYDIYNMSFHDNSYSNLYADLTLTWQGNYLVGNSVLSPSAGLGIRQSLTGSDIDSNYDLFNTRYKSEVSSDSTTFLANAGLEWTKGSFTLGANYSGEFGSDQTSHTGSLNFKFNF